MLLILIVILSTALGRVNFVAGGPSLLAYSTDAIDWSLVTNPPFSITSYAMAYSKELDLWVATGDGTINTLAWSVDGMNWTGIGKTIFTVRAQCIAYSARQGLWVAGGEGGPNTLARSTDGKTWIGTGATIFSRTNNIAYSPVADRWVATGFSLNTWAWSDNGIIWNGMGTTLMAQQGGSIDYNNGLLMMSDVFNIWSSVDGLNWNRGSPTLQAGVYDVAYGQGKWISGGAAVPDPQIFATSTDGGNWTVRQPMTSQLKYVRSLVYSVNFNLWVAVGLGTTLNVMTSPDGVDWTFASGSFSTRGYSIATRNSIILNTNIINLNINSSVVPIGVDVRISGNLVVSGDLEIVGSWRLANSSKIAVSNELTLIGNTTLEPGSGFRIDVDTLIIINNSARLVLLITENITVSNGNTVVVDVVTFKTRSGTIDVVAQGVDPSVCLGTQPIYSSSSLSVTVSAVQCPVTGVVVKTDGLPIGAIIGICMGSIVIAATAIILLVVLTLRYRKKMDRVSNAKLREASLNGLRK